MAKCDEGYRCDVCGGDVEKISESDLYLRYVIGLIDPEVLHTMQERHIRCNPSLAQFIVDETFEPVAAEPVAAEPVAAEPVAAVDADGKPKKKTTRRRKKKRSPSSSWCRPR